MTARMPFEKNWSVAKQSQRMKASTESLGSAAQDQWFQGVLWVGWKKKPRFRRKNKGCHSTWYYKLVERAHKLQDHTNGSVIVAIWGEKNEKK